MAAAPGGQLRASARLLNDAIVLTDNREMPRSDLERIRAALLGVGMRARA